MKIKRFSKSDFITSKWSGGETTQLAIFPENAVFSDKDFLFRISSATFTSTESNFSDFRNYQRYILPLEGKLSVHHMKLYARNLEPFEVEYFDGAWSTHSQNSPDCRDYNFIYRKGRQAKLALLEHGTKLKVELGSFCTLFSRYEAIIFLNNEEYNLEPFTLLMIYTEAQSLKMRVKKTPVPIILSEFKY